MGQPDKELEGLLADFGINSERAREVARKQTSNEFEAKLNRLEAFIGIDTAYAVVRESSQEEGDSFLDYRNSALETYFGLVEKVSTIMKDQVSGKGNEKLARLFYSIETLQGFLQKPDETLKQERSRFDVTPYPILYRSNDQSAAYLNTLIEKGKLIVGDHEHWSRNGTKGPRGKNILINIKTQLAHAFNYAGLEKPNLRINYGGQALMVEDDLTRKNLRVLRDIAYHS